MTITKIAQKRANKMISILSSANYTDEFPCRQYDNCAEMGDGTMVICEIMRQANKDQGIMDLLKSYPASQYVDLIGWQKTYEENYLQKTA